jgi:NADPH:quinone reductase-like Zn-dependent oxidoreductase
VLTLVPMLPLHTAGPHHLKPSPRGALGNLVPSPVDLGAAPGLGRVTLAVQAVGLNFRDVLNVSGGGVG